MKIVVMCMMNRLLSGAIIKYLRERGELMPIKVMDCRNDDEPYNTCKSHKANILLMEVSRVRPFTLEERLETANKVRKAQPECKIVILCDENSDPDMAERVKESKKRGYIDSFFYSSVSGEYLAAMLDAI